MQPAIHPETTESSLLQMPIRQLRALLRSRKLSPVELTDAHIRQIQKVNPEINAVVAERFDEARKEAARAADRLARARSDEQPGALAGIPCTVKDFLAVENMPQTAGLTVRKDYRASEDATVVRRLRRAGAIVLGTTNVPEGGLWMESRNPIFGRTNNPWDLSRTAGGSSGGEAAIVAAGGSVFGVGTDVGGSIRIPAAFCGVFGHKPTGRLVPNTGHWMQPTGPAGAYLACGPIARSAVDLMELLRIMAGPDGSDPLTRRQALGDPEDIDLSQVTAYPVEGSERTAVWPSMKEAVRKAAKALESRGARVEPLESRRMKYALGIWGAMMTEHPGPTYAEMLGDGKPVSLFREMLKWPLGRSNHTATSLCMIMVEGVLTKMSRAHGRLADVGRRLQAELEEKLGPNGVILHPPFSRPAPYHHEPLLTPFDFALSGLFNVLEFPATQVPVGFDSRGMPVGVQVIARRFNDHLTIGLASVLEQELGGWTRAEVLWDRAV